MNAAMVIELLDLIGVTGVSEEAGSGRLQACCPFAKWRHRDKNDKQTTLNIEHLGEAQNPTFSCSKCGTMGGLSDLVYQLQALTGRLYPEAFMMLPEAPELSQTTPIQPKRRIRVETSISQIQPTRQDVRTALANEVLDEYPLLEGCELTDARAVMDWLHHTHGIKPSIIFRHKLRLYVDPLIGDLGVVLPVIKPDDGSICELWTWMIGGEKPHRMQTKKAETNANRQTASALFGMEHLAKGEPMLMVQSALAALKLESLGVAKVVAVLGRLAPETLRFGHVSNIYLAFDDTQPGRDMVRMAHKHVNSDRTYFLRWSETRRSNRKYLLHAQDIESLAQFKEVFSSRIVLGKP